MTTSDNTQSWLSSQLAGVPKALDGVPKGFFVSAVVAICAQFLSDHYGAPAMLMALLLGIAFHFLAEEGPCKVGIEFTAKTVLRIGVALLGVRISVELLIGLGPAFITLIVAGVILTVRSARCEISGPGLATGAADRWLSCYLRCIGRHGNRGSPATQ